jgi:hypothetical protein
MNSLHIIASIISFSVVLTVIVILFGSEGVR